MFKFWLHRSSFSQKNRRAWLGLICERRTKRWGGNNRCRCAKTKQINTGNSDLIRAARSTFNKKKLKEENSQVINDENEKEIEKIKCKLVKRNKPRCLSIKFLKARLKPNTHARALIFMHKQRNDTNLGKYASPAASQQLLQIIRTTITKLMQQQQKLHSQWK